MTQSNEDRLERIEQILERIGERIDSLVEVGEKVDKRIDSNAKAIESLTNERKLVEEKLDRDRARLYQSMADLASAQAGFYSRLSEVDKRQDALSRRPGEIVQILKLLTQGSSPEA